MLKMRKYEAFEKMTKLCGPWNTWGRAEHIAYGLIRGIPYEKMERTANDNPHAVEFSGVLWKIGAWPENPCDGRGSWLLPRELRDECNKLVIWVKKVPRIKHDEVESAE